MSVNYCSPTPRRHAADPLKPFDVVEQNVNNAPTPRRHAADPLKPLRSNRPRQSRWRPTPRRHAADPLKLVVIHLPPAVSPGYTAATCRGPIEAGLGSSKSPTVVDYTAATCRGPIEAPPGNNASHAPSSYTAATCRGPIE